MSDVDTATNTILHMVGRSFDALPSVLDACQVDQAWSSACRSLQLWQRLYDEFMRRYGNSLENRSQEAEIGIVRPIPTRSAFEASLSNVGERGRVTRIKKRIVDMFFAGIVEGWIDTSLAAFVITCTKFLTHKSTTKKEVVQETRKALARKFSPHLLLHVATLCYASKRQEVEYWRANKRNPRFYEDRMQPLLEIVGEVGQR